MKIKRKFCGEEYEIELSPDELYQAYREQEHKFDRNDVEDLINAFDDEDLQFEYGMSRAEIEEKFDEIAYEMRRQIDKYDVDWSYARDEAADQILRGEH